MPWWLNWSNVSWRPMTTTVMEKLKFERCNTGFPIIWTKLKVLFVFSVGPIVAYGRKFSLIVSFRQSTWFKRRIHEGKFNEKSFFLYKSLETFHSSDLWSYKSNEKIFRSDEPPNNSSFFHNVKMHKITICKIEFFYWTIFILQVKAIKFTMTEKIPTIWKKAFFEQL